MNLMVTMENKEIINNEYYSLSELFSTPNRKVIIPDFQRDYCWGDKTHGEKHDTDIVSGFLDTLIEEYNSNHNSDVLLGKIDVYEHPKNHIYLTDGQQRLTSLYLIVGMLYRQEQDEEMKKRLKSCLLSDFEENEDGKEPYLQYAVRESTLFFLRDLVNEFFITKNLLRASDIPKQSWYFTEYNLDPSVISMLSALDSIESKLKNIGESFSRFVIDNVKIQYYDVNDKKHGEERFVIINTTGKGLTVSENIKPILLGNINKEEFANQWEERETWFWKNRNKDKENIADNGVNDFLTWCFQIVEKQDEIDIIKKAKQLLKNKENEKYLLDIQKHYSSLLQLVEYLKEDKFQEQFKFINDSTEIKGIVDLRSLSKEKQQNVLLPLIAFISNFEDDKEGIYQFSRRLRKNYFDQKWKDRNGNYIDWRYILQIIEKSNSAGQVLSFETNESTIDKIQNVNLNNWYNEEEIIKVKLKETHKEEIEEWEDHPDFMGDLSFLLKTTLVTNESDNILEISLQNVFTFDRLNSVFKNYAATIDLIRNESSANNNLKLANMFRLFCLFIGCNRVGHIYRASWDFEGVLFSTLNREHLSKLEFMKLLNSLDMLSYCTLFIKRKIRENGLFDLTDFNVEKFIKAWLSLKVFYANQQNKLLAFYDGKGTGVAAYRDKNSNRLISSEEFSLANSICGFGVRSGFGAGNYVHYTKKDLWNHPHIIDTPFSVISFDEKDRTKDQLEKNKEIIECIIRTISL